jgi:hypothetical protein
VYLLLLDVFALQLNQTFLVNVLVTHYSFVMVTLGDLLVILVLSQEVVMNSVLPILPKHPAPTVVVCLESPVPLLVSPQLAPQLQEILDLVAHHVISVMGVPQQLHQLPLLQMPVMQSV